MESAKQVDKKRRRRAKLKKAKRTGQALRMRKAQLLEQDFNARVEMRRVLLAQQQRIEQHDETLAVVDEILDDINTRLSKLENPNA